MLNKLSVVIVSAAFMASAGAALAVTVDAPAGMIGSDSLNGEDAYLWTVASGSVVPAGQTLSSVTVNFDNIAETVAGAGNDITIDVGSFVNMAVDKSSVASAGNYGTVVDNDALGDAFQGNINAGDAIRLATMDFTTLNDPQSLSITLSSSQLTTLQDYMSAGAWGLEIDPDCHFNVGGISVTYTTGPRTVPDNGSTLMLLGGCFVGLMMWQRRFAEKQVC
jgi:hypothetical protein